jgi:hypothetical protein
MYKYFTFYTECPTTYQTRHFFNNSKTNEDIAMRFEQEYVHCVRNVSVVRLIVVTRSSGPPASQPVSCLTCLSAYLCHLAEGA